MYCGLTRNFLPIDRVPEKSKFSIEYSYIMCFFSGETRVPRRTYVRMFVRAFTNSVLRWCTFFWWCLFVTIILLQWRAFPKRAFLLCLLNFFSPKPSKYDSPYIILYLLYIFLLDILTRTSPLLSMSLSIVRDYQYIKVILNSITCKCRYIHYSLFVSRYIVIRLKVEKAHGGSGVDA